MSRFTFPQACLLLSCFGGFVAALFAEPASVPALPSTTPTSRAAVVTSPFRWRLMPDSSGASCEGLVFHPADASIRYAYSASAGASRWASDRQQWTGMSDWSRTASFSRVSALAIDPTDRSVIYYVAGDLRAELFASVDSGQTFVPSDLADPEGRPLPAGGPAGPGERLVVDPNNPAVIYYASRLGGLWRTVRSSLPGTWAKVESFTARGDVESTVDLDRSMHTAAPDGGLSFVAVDSLGGTVEIDGVKRSRVLFVGVVGDHYSKPDFGRKPVTRSTEGGLWRSTDGGVSWGLLAGPLEQDNRATAGDTNSDGTLWAIINGKIVKAGRGGRRVIATGSPADLSFATLAVDPANSRHIVASIDLKLTRFLVPATIPSATLPAQPASQPAARFYRTTDGGIIWSPLLAEFSSSITVSHELAPPTAMKFEPNCPKDAAGRGKSLWIGDRAGPWVCNDLDAAQTHWKLISRGRSSLNVTSIATPPAVDGRALPIAWATATDVGGLAYSGTTAPPSVTSAQVFRPSSQPTTQPASINGWHTSFCESDPRILAVAGTGGLALFDGRGEGRAIPLALTPTDESARGSGVLRAALGSSSIGDFPAILCLIDRQMPRYSLDRGKTWAASTGAPAWRSAAQDSPSQPLVADPLDPKTFYYFSDNLDGSGNGRSFITTDAGATWTPGGIIRYASPFRPIGDHHLVATPGRNGDLWLCIAEAYSPRKRANADGLYHSTDGGRSWIKVVGWTRAFCVAIGAPSPESPDVPSVVIAGELEGEEGIYLSKDAAMKNASPTNAHWQKVWDPESTDTAAIAFGLRCTAADRQVFGRIYVGTNGIGRGLFFGEPVLIAPPAAPTQVRTIRTDKGTAIEWADPVGAAEYDLQRMTLNPQSDWQTIVSAAWQSRVVDTTADPKVEYRYRVIASNAMGRSEPTLSDVRVSVKPK